MMKVAVISANSISDRFFKRWAEIQQSNPELVSPFFRPEFTQSVAKVRSDAFVAVINDGEAFFPFQRNRFGLGRPVGGTASDYHGLVADVDFQCDISALLRACGLRSWNFDHVLASQSTFSAHRTTVTDSPVVDVAKDSPIGTTSLHSDHRRKWRMLERDFGKVEVDLDATDPSLLELCLEWKSAQYERTGMPDLFARPWARSLARAIASLQKPEFAGIVSVLHAGGQPVAVHFGMRTRTVWHWWFPAYAPQFHRYSPGILLLLQMIAAAPRLGVETIDFGKGDNDYKSRFANRRVPLIEGHITTSYPLLLLNESKQRIIEIARRDKSVAAVLAPLRGIYRWAKTR